MLRVVSDSLSNTNLTYYFGPFVHEGELGGTSSLKYIMTPEGRIINKGTDGTPIWSWEYNLTDHLGNVRVVIAPLGTAGFSTLLQQTHYYPYGMRMSQISTSDNTDNDYLFGGKQLQDDFGLNWYFYEKRFYDPCGRLGFTSVDPMADINYQISPYAYCLNNPVKYIDPNGMWASHTKLESAIGLEEMWEDEAESEEEEEKTNKKNALKMLQESSPKTNTASNNSSVSDGVGGSLIDYAYDLINVLNQFNPVANGWDAVTGYIYGTDRFGNPQSSLETGLKAASIIPIGRIGSLGINAAKGVVKGGKSLVQANRAAGNLFRDELATALRAEGRTVNTEVYKWTPFGKRYMDLDVWHNGVNLGGIETKVGGSRYLPLQRLKDTWLDANGYPVQLVRKPANW